MLAGHMRSPAHLMSGYQNLTTVLGVVHNLAVSLNWSLEIGLRNSTWFTRPFLVRRCILAGHVTVI